MGSSSNRNSDSHRPAAIDFGKTSSPPAEPNHDTIQVREDFKEAQTDGNWYELRFEGKQPRRRAYHTSFIYEDKIFVLGGHDIAEGSMDSLWSFDLRKIGNLESSSADLHSNDVHFSWSELKTSGIRMPRKFTVS